ncbi:MAG: hypothetical protein GXO93_00370 [FCB group bacterium]|nr:hypothetical protein [FCB group bacterium]
MFNIHLQDLPPFAKLFVGIFTALILCVSLWAVLIFYVEEGIVNQNHLPAYLTSSAELQRQKDIEEITADSQSVVAPIWDSTLEGEEEKVDTVTMEQKFRSSDSEQEANAVDTISQVESKKDRIRHLRKNVGLAHTHINGQTLLFFAIGLVFLFTSVKPKVKKVVYWVFGIAVLLNSIGLSGKGFYSVFNAVSSVSEVVILVVIVYMAFLIFVDLSRKGSMASHKIEKQSE